ncbi:ATP-binding protein [Rothia aerolata]|uniref:ATPase AAA n=1 Tax=Rothia aerolata TaxID=1812262 RepID=A0A917IU75_9MICC|nr:DUF4143 domain-containing protein [Rothia aerolata]GGH64553.1 ATPase AAA [Rothia aerolata]
MNYLARSLDLELDELLPYVSAVAIDGPKGVGKTDTARRRAKHRFFLDNPDQRQVIEADLNFSFIKDNQPVLLDEWQKVPAVWDSVRRKVDSGATPGQFLLTGSATPTEENDTHSGAGRILSLRMRPLTFYEKYRNEEAIGLADLLQGRAKIAGKSTAGLTDYFDAIVESGFPGIYSLPPRVRRAQLDAYIQRIIDKDLLELGYKVRRPETLLRWLRAYAAASSSTTAYSKLLDTTTAGDGHQPAKTTTIAYRDFLSKLWLLDPVPGWLPVGNEFTRLATAPKHQLADPGLAARLLQVSSAQLVAEKSHLAGPLFESLVTLSVRVAAQAAEATVSHLRTKNGDREVDLIVQGAGGEVLGIEVKLTPQVSDEDVKHLLWLRENVPQVVDTVVVTTGAQAYRRPDGVAVIPLALLSD